MSERTWVLALVVGCGLLAGCGDDSGSDADAAGDGEIGDVGDDGEAEARVEVEAGRCGDGVVQSREECDDANEVAGDGCESDCTVSCHGRADCDDGLDCTTDGCERTGGGFACVFEVAEGYCRIAGECVADGTAQPGNVCLVCEAAADAEDWSGAPMGTSCADDDFCQCSPPLATIRSLSCPSCFVKL